MDGELMNKSTQFTYSERAVHVHIMRRMHYTEMKLYYMKNCTASLAVTIRTKKVTFIWAR